MNKNVSFSKVISSASAKHSHKKTLSLLISAGLLSTSMSCLADGAVWVTQVNGGEVRFYDWGYSGPQGQNAGQFGYDGFDGAAQIQHVITTGPDGLTPDSPYTVQQDLTNAIDYADANMDSQTNFFGWGYTTTAGSTFNNMQIDADGDYYIARDDMDFAFYDTFDYKYEGTGTQTVADGTIDTLIDFQPYALSDATGWCGSVDATNPSALDAMAGQVTFDFGFEAFFPWSTPGATPGTGSMQIVQDFQMRSYGSLEVDISSANGGVGDFNFQADAVVNNTNPLDSTVLTDVNGDPLMIEVPVLNMDGTPALDENGQPRTMMVPQQEVGAGGVDEDYYNLVSFMGGGVVPEGVWVKVIDTTAPMSNDNILEVLDEDDGAVDTVWWQNSFAGYPFLLRADGIRIVDALDFSLYDDFSKTPQFAFDSNGNLINQEGKVVQDLSAVPVPASAWLMASGLIGLISFVRRRRQ